MTPLYINGKFVAQRTTGVQRVAAQLIAALDRQEIPRRCILLCPEGAAVPALRRIEARAIGRAGMPLHAWEQWALPRAAEDGLLVSLAGAAPAFARRQVCMLHDAAVFDRPESYTRAFVTWYRWLFRRLARTAQGLLTVSAFSRDRLAEHLHIEPKCLHVLPNGADHLDAIASDTSVLNRLGLNGRSFLLAVGNASPAKNLGMLTAAYRRLPSDALPALVVVGERDARVFANSPAASVPGVVYAGSVTDPALKALYEHATALIFPSLYEGSGLPPLEAMACGCPAIVAKAAAIPEACGDGALYIDPLSVDGLANALRDVIGDAALRARLRDAGRAHARRFRWADSAARLLSVLSTDDARRVRHA